MAPDDPRKKGDGDHGEGHGPVPEDRLAREHRQDVGGHAHGGKHQNVDFRMAEEPEQVLPQERHAARGQEKVGVEDTIEEKHAQGPR